MKKKRKNESSGDLSFKPVVKYIIYFYVVVLLAELLVVSAYTIHSMKKEGDFLVTTTESQLEYRIHNTIALLTSLTNNQYFRDPTVPYPEKAVALTACSKDFGYLMICIVDEDVNVWDEAGSNANLASRAYMQQLFATGEVQVTDSFAAGSDGTTLNHTVAVPMYEDEQVVGCIFAAISFSEIEGLLKTNTFDTYQEVMLFGSNNQVMSIPNTDQYGKTYIALSQNEIFLGTTAKQVEEAMYNQQVSSHWSFVGGNLAYESTVPIANTKWTLLSRLTFWGTMEQSAPQLLFLFFITTATCALMVLLANRFIRSKRETVDMLITSVQELEKKIYQNEKPDNVDFKEILSLTSKGLTDGLTGVITRTVFLNQIQKKIKSIEPGTFSAMCFVDVDNLKTINDTYGHGIGDVALKSIGYVLREYEKKYDGLVGRYGGDEFVLLLTGFDSMELLEDLIAELTIRLHSEISTGDGTIIPTQCSVGVSVCDNRSEDVDRLIKQADEMLYLVKQTEKGRHKIYNGLK